MNIVIASGIFLPEIGGPATYADKIAREFLKLNYKVKVITYSDKILYQLDNDLPYSVFRIKRGNKFKNYLKYFKILKKQAKNSDIIYVFDHFSAGIPSAIFSKIYKKKLFIRVGGDFIWERYINKTDNLITLADFYKNNFHIKKERIRFNLIKWVFKVASGIIFTTEFQRDIFKKYYYLSVDKLSVIHNPINTNVQIFHKNKKNKEIIFAGRFVSKNNIINLIKAFKNVKTNSFKLILIGEGPLKNRLKKLIKDSDKIKIENKLSRHELKEKFTKSYLVVFPSLTDISPNSMLECLQSRTPFISSREIGFDWIKDKIILFDPLSILDITTKIDYLLDEKNYQKYLSKIKNINYNYSYARATQDIINILK